MVEIFAINVEEEVDDDVVAALCANISDDRREQAQRYGREIDRKRCIYAAALVRYLACKKFGLKKDMVQIDRNEYGKPFFIKPESQFFNISHAGKWVICGWSQHEIGIDVEYIGDTNFDIAARFFDESEYMAIMNRDTQQRREMFYELWTLKESYIKYKGKGLSISLKSFKFRLDNDNTVLFSDNEEDDKLNFFRYTIDENHKLSICTSDICVETINYIDLNEILLLLQK